MCLYSKLIINKKYTNTKKNGGNIPPIKDMRTLYIPVECGNCIECRKKKTREWQVRLLEDIKTNKGGKFVTLTFSNKSIAELCKHKKLQGLQGYTLDNGIAKLAVRLWLERHRKKYGRSMRHWLVTELGHNGTENIHLHGIVWPDSAESWEKLSETWQYGWIWQGKEILKKSNGGYKTEYINYVNERTIGYITKYVSKQDAKHKYYKSKILTTPGIGNNYTNTHNSKINKYKEEETQETYRTGTGHKIGLPTYWRNKIYTEEEKEKLWINRLNKEIRWVRGEKIDVSKGMTEYWKIINWHRTLNKEMGYRGSEIDYNMKEQEELARIQQTETRIKNALRSKKIIIEKERIKKIIQETYRPTAI